MPGTACGQQCAAVGAEDHGNHLAAVRQSGKKLSRGRVPKPSGISGIIMSCGHERAAVGTEGHELYSERVGQLPQEFARIHLPQAGYSIPASR
jgi:hypothetical protein